MSLLFDDDKKDDDKDIKKSNSSRGHFNFINSIKSPATVKVYEFAIKKYL